MEVKRQLTRLAAGTAIIAAAAFASVGLAQADGMPSKGRVVYESPSNWSGLYFGVQSGWIWSDIDTTYTAAGGVFGNSWGHDTQMVGGQIGLQHQFGLIVVGVEGDLVSAFRNHEAVEVCPNVAVDCHARFNDVVTLGGRLGTRWASGCRSSAAAMPTARLTARRSIAPPAPRTTTTTPVIVAGTSGGGVDMALAHGWNIGLEYRHYDFDDFFHSAFNAAGAPVAGSHNVMDASSDFIALRVSWKLGRPERRASQEAGFTYVMQRAAAGIAAALSRWEDP